MTRKSPLTRTLTMAQRREFHNRLQISKGHWMPDPDHRGTRPGWSYRAARRNALHSAGLLGRANA